MNRSTKGFIFFLKLLILTHFQFLAFFRELLMIFSGVVFGLYSGHGFDRGGRFF